MLMVMIWRGWDVWYWEGWIGNDGMIREWDVCGLEWELQNCKQNENQMSGSWDNRSQSFVKSPLHVKIFCRRPGLGLENFWFFSFVSEGGVLAALDVFYYIKGRQIFWGNDNPFPLFLFPRAQREPPRARVDPSTKARYRFEPTLSPFFSQELRCYRRRPPLPREMDGQTDTCNEFHRQVNFCLYFLFSIYFLCASRVTIPMLSLWLCIRHCWKSYESF